jgi:hypothetical protein
MSLAGEGRAQVARTTAEALLPRLATAGEGSRTEVRLRKEEP